MKTTFIRGLPLVVISGLCFSDVAAQTPFSSSVTLKGQSSGGVLTLMKAPTHNYPYLAITNKPGETAASVIARLASQLINCSACEKYGRGSVLEVTESSLVLLGGPMPLGTKRASLWILGGTETGFSIPPAPLSVSASYVSNRVVLEWVNPPGGYDSLMVADQGFPRGVPLPGEMTRYVYNPQDVFPRPPVQEWVDATFVVIGYKAGTPSNGAGVRLRRHAEQESLMNIPFTSGVAPGFRKWNHRTSTEAIAFEQGNLPGVAPASDLGKFGGKGFFQIITGHGSFQGGVSRCFLGLTPGHTYRVGARLSTLETKQGNWSFSFHAAYNPAGGNDLTRAQMAGDEALPDGTKGKTAGQIARYDSTTTTDGNWVQRFSTEKKSDNAVHDITMPATENNSITIWFRLEGKDVTDVAVGFDSVTIEDLGEKK